MMVDRLRAAIELPGSLLDNPSGPRDDWPYFVIWRDDGSVLAESDAPDRILSNDQAAVRRDRAARGGFPPGFRWSPGDLRETVVAGPRGTTILVGKPVGRELAELRWFAWRLLASGGVLLTVGLAGGWLISRSITRPINAIALTASEISARNLARRIELSGLDQELVGLAAILNEMFARLEAAFDRQSRFTSDASHELRTPLAVIHAHAELALSRPRSADEYRETLAACLKAAGRMGTLVDGLLTLARADAGRLDPQFREVDLRSVVEEVIDQYRPQAAAAGIELSTAIDEPVSVRGDVTLLARVSSNLLSNALRYTPTGGHVHVTLSAAGLDAAVLAVEDTGCGIPLEDQSKVFERFFRADKARTRSQGGNGLGLAICKSLVEAHHGSIGFTSTPDRGSRFEVRLPQIASAASAGPRLNGPPAEHSDANGGA
jgi:two-component system OmpR family sensor kinase